MNIPTDDDIRKWEEAAEKATPGWVIEMNHISGMVPWGRPNGEIIAKFETHRTKYQFDDPQDIANAAFAALSRTALPALCKEVRRLREAAQALVDYRARISPLNFQLEKLDDYIRALEAPHA